MKPLLLMRTRGLLGPLFGRHAGVPGLSKSSGNSIRLAPVPPLSGWNWLVGSAGFLRGYRPLFHPTNNFGGLNPNRVEGLLVQQLTVNVTNGIAVLQLGTGGSDQIPGILSVVVFVPAYPNSFVTLTWNAGQTRYDTTNGAFASWVDSQVGEVVNIVDFIPSAAIVTDGSELLPSNAQP